MLRLLLLWSSLLLTASAIDVGQRVPPLSGATWLQGESPALGSRACLVLFWATWNDPSPIAILRRFASLTVAPAAACVSVEELSLIHI
jgi:hypothetical protein